MFISVSIYTKFGYQFLVKRINYVHVRLIETILLKIFGIVPVRVQVFAMILNVKSTIINM